MRSMSALLLFTLCAFAVRGQGTDGELLKNPGFNEDADENGLPDHWSTTHERVLWREKVFMGKDYEVVSRLPTYVLATQDIELKPGETYTITVTCKGEDGGVAGALIVQGEEKPVREMPLLWNVQPTEQYEEYVRTFVAPNPVARLFIYNIAKSRGTVYYDHVSLRRGEPDHAVIGQLSLREIDRPLSAPVQTPHIPWATPLAGGPVKTFCTLRNYRCLRQVLELSQRLDLDLDVVHTGVRGDECVSDTGRRATKRLKQGYYDVYVIPSRVNDALAEEIRGRVSAGAGLVVVEGFGRASRFVDRASLSKADDTHFVRSGIPWDVMPEKILASVETGELGKGRVVRLLFPLDISRVWGLMPIENTKEAYRGRQFEFWEWWESLLARAVVWAARREGGVTLDLTESGSGERVLTVAGSPAGAKVRTSVRSGREVRFDGPLLRMPLRTDALGPGGRLPLDVPPQFPAGLRIVDAMALDAEERVLAWKSFALRTPQAAVIDSLSADRGSYAPGDTVVLRARLRGDAPCSAGLEGKLIDAFGRVVDVATRSLSLPTGEVETELRLRLRAPLSVLHRGFLRLTVAGSEQDSRWVPVFVPSVGPRQAASDFMAMPWAPGMSHPVELEYYADRVRELGLNAEFASDPYLIAEHGFPAAGYVGQIGGTFRENKHAKDGVRSRCLSDPAVIETIAARTLESAEARKPYGLFGVGITDEAFLSSRHKRTEFCFSEHCQGRYRDWLKGQYGSLDALNRQWGTSHRSWEDVRGARTEDVRGSGNAGPFVDFRTFMTDVWVDACRLVVDTYHGVDATMPIGHTNTFGAGPFNGNDYWKLCTQTGFGWGQEYSEAIKGSGHKAIFDLWRSFAGLPRAGAGSGPAGGSGAFFNYGWIGYDHREAAAHYEPWWLALHGSRGVSYFATNAMDATRGTSWALVYQTLSFTPYSLAVKEALADLRGGCGKLFMEFERERPQVGLLWSHPSMLVAWCESLEDQPVPNERDGTDSYGTYFRSALHFRQHLNELQLDYDYIAPPQLADTKLLDQHRALFLPFTVALSEAAVAQLEAYVQRGGLLVGDLRCCRTDEHGRPFADSSVLRRLFGVVRTSDTVSYEATEVTVGESPAFEVFGREALRVEGGTATGTHATGEPAVVAYGQPGGGATFYLNFALPAYDRSVRTLIEEILVYAQVRREVVAEAADGAEPPRCYERNTFSRGGNQVHAFIRDHRRCEDSDPVRFAFGSKAHVYDVRAGKYLGLTDTAEAVVPPGHTAVYACLPYRVTGLRLGVAGSLTAGSDLTVRIEVGAEGGTAGDHVVHLEALDPNGEPVWHYARNVLAPGGRLDLSIPLAINERPGSWRLRARDVLTGTETEAAFTVSAR